MAVMSREVPEKSDFVSDMNIDHEGRPLETEKGRMEFQVEKGGRGVRWYERVKWTSLKTREFCVATE